MDKALKQRLVGATVLIIFAVIVLPMLLSGRSHRLKHESSDIELPPKPAELTFETRRFPVGVSKESTQTNADTTETSVLPAASGESDKQGVQGVPVQKPDVNTRKGMNFDHAPTSPKTTAKPVKDSVAKTTVLKNPVAESENSKSVSMGNDQPRYLVQVASFSSEKRAKKLADQLRADKMKVITDVIDRTGGRLHRVRVGPYVERAQADAALTRIAAKAKDLRPRILDLRPTESAPVSSPYDPLVRWVVQVGSYSSEDTARAQVASLRLAGFSAFYESISASTTTSYKVRVGPEISRDAAVQLASKLKAGQNLDGFVTTQE